MVSDERRVRVVSIGGAHSSGGGSERPDASTDDALAGKRAPFDVQVVPHVAAAREELATADAEVDCVACHERVVDPMAAVDAARAERPSLPVLVLAEGDGSAHEAILDRDLTTVVPADAPPALVADRVASLVDHSRARRRADRGRHTVDVLDEVTRLLTRDEPPEVVAQCVCDRITDLPAVRAAAVVGPEDVDDGVSPLAVAGADRAVVERLSVDGDVPDGTALAAARRTDGVVTRSVDGETDTAWHEALLDRGLCSVASVSLEGNGEDCGALLAAADDPAAFDAAGEELLADVAAALARTFDRQRPSTRERAIDEAPIGISIADTSREDNPVIYANEAFETITGYDHEDAFGQNHRFLQGPETSDEPVATLREAIRNEEGATVELRNYRADGSPFWNRVSVAPLRDADGGVRRYVGFQEDVTEQRERRRELERYETIVENLPVGVFRTTADGEFVDVNEALVSLLGGDDASDILDHEVSDFYVDPERRSELLSQLEARGRVSDEEVELRALTGETVRATVTMSLAESDEETYLDGIVQDLTPDYERRQRRRRQQEALFELATDDAVGSGEFETAVRRITETAASVLDVPRVNIWLLEDESTLTCVDHYDGRTDVHEDGMELVADNYPSYFEALRTHRSLSAVDAQSDPRTEELSPYLTEHGVEALLDATLRSGGDVVGVVCHEHVGDTREWTEDEQEFAAGIAEVVDRALRNRQRVERRRDLQFQQSLLEAQQEAVLDGILVVDEDGTVISYNDRFLELWDLSEPAVEDRDGRDVLSRISDLVAEPATFPDREGPVGDGLGTDRDTLELVDGRIFDRYTTDLAADDGTPLGRLWTFRDITERRRREQERLRNERRFKAVFEDPEILVGLLSVGGDVLRVNQTAAAYVEPDRETVVGTPLWETPWFRDTPSSSVREWIDRATDGEYVPFEIELDRSARDQHVFDGTIRPVSDENGDVVSLIASGRDITERRDRERQLEVFDRLLRHNLRNEMTVIAGNADWIVDESTGEIAQRAGKIVDAGRRLQALADKQREIVDLITEQPAVKRVDIAGILGNLIETVRERHPAARVRASIPESLHVRAILQIERAIEEIIENAVVHSDRDAPTVRVETTAGPEVVVIEITDDGPGIPSHETSVLLNDYSVSRLSHSRGMGFWLVSRIVDQSGGAVEVESRAPRGSIVRIVLERADD